MLDPNDGGYLSRKLLFGAGICVGAMVSTALAAWKLPAMLPVLDTMLGVQVAIYAIYCGANVSNKWTVGKVAAALTDETEPAQKKDPAPAQQDGEDDAD